MAPLSLQRVELEAPLEAEQPEVLAMAEASDCPTGSDRPGSISTMHRLVLNATGTPPVFEGDVTEVKLPPEPPPPPRPKALR